MLTFRVLDTWLLILFVFELTFPVKSSRYNEKCYPVGNRDVCFFQPQANLTRITRLDAWGICRRSNGTLPTILDAGIQSVFEEYMNSLELKDIEDMWLAGREYRVREWTWANGVPFNEPAYFSQTQNEDKSYHLQAVLVDDLLYRKEYLGNRNNYICQYFGAACQSKDSIPLKNGCLLLNNGETLDLYDSRNKCVDRGGDLAIIDGLDDLNKFRQVFARTRKAAKLWIGLRRQWWIWGGTDYEIKYSNWLLDNGFKSDRECMVVELKDYLWKQENCSSYKRFICQTGPANVEYPPAPKSDGQPRLSFVVVLIAGISAAVITILLVVIIVVVVVKKRKPKRRQANREDVPRDTSYQNLRHQLNEQGNITSNQQYTALQPPTRKPLLLPTDSPLQSQQTELNPDHLYDDIADTRIPHYLEITH